MSRLSGPLRHGLSRDERVKVALLGSWFFVITATLWLLKPIRTAALLTHLGSGELPYLRAGSVVFVGLMVFGYCRVVTYLSRLQVALGASALFTILILWLWVGLELGLGAERWFVWAVFILVDLYASVMVTIFWTYTNDVVSRGEADRLYAPIGIGGILGGVAGGVAIDSFVHSLGQMQLLVCAGGVMLGGLFPWVVEVVLRPAPRVLVLRGQAAVSGTLEGARAMFRSEYLLWMVGVVVAYESAAALTDFSVNVIFERAFSSEVELAQMYGRLGWIVSATALLSQLVLVPLLLPTKRAALLVPPLIMAAATIALIVMPVLVVAIVLAASDRGLNYSLQQVTRETLYVPLGDSERYKAKAFIDIFVDRAAKAVASLGLVVVISLSGASPRASLLLALGALLFWVRCAHALGTAYAQRVARSGSKGAALPVNGSAPGESTALAVTPQRADP